MKLAVDANRGSAALRFWGIPLQFPETNKEHGLPTAAITYNGPFYAHPGARTAPVGVGSSCSRGPRAGTLDWPQPARTGNVGLMLPI
jgi:hypothetical protein